MTLDQALERIAELEKELAYWRSPIDLSDCCGAPLLCSSDDPICSFCREHCGVAND